MLRKIFRGFLIFIALLIVLAAAMVGSIDRTPLAEQEFYTDMMRRLDTTAFASLPAAPVKVGWSKVNITPGGSMPMAGYVPRERFEAVHDSLYARILVVESGSFRAAFVDVDLLIFPPRLRDELVSSVKDNSFLYLSATHTHNGVGGWDSSIGGRLITGKYSEDWVDSTAHRIAETIHNTSAITSTIEYFEAEASDLVENRIEEDTGKVDGKLRGLKIARSDSSTAVLFTFSAHPTSIESNKLDLSADYPAKTIQLLEEKNNFAMFMSGMVGSHRFKFSPDDGYTFINNIAPQVVSRIDTAAHAAPMDSAAVRYAHIPIEFGPAQARIDRNWKVNNWAFRMVFNKLKGEFTYLELGDVVFIGTPCDFSGEIYAVDSLERFAGERGKHLIITSFNGDYVGYITEDHHYETSKKEEINALNWVGPHYGEYFSTMIKKLLSK